jgi:2-phosphosulfolactate phosphatase
MRPTVAIDAFSGRLEADYRGWALVAIDVIRATTTAVTAVAQGRRCLPAASVEAAAALAARLSEPLLVGELAGKVPAGFHLDNSPAEVASRNDTWRPMVLLSSSGTQLLCAAAACGACVTYVGSLRNYAAQTARLASDQASVVLLGAASRGEFRLEDQLCCARIAAGLGRRGYAIRDSATGRIVERWSEASLDAINDSPSAGFLSSTGRLADLSFVLTHDDDLDTVFQLEQGEIVPAPTPRLRPELFIPIQAPTARPVPEV